MPIIKSAIKKMRKDKKRTAHNKEIKENIKSLIKQMRRSPSDDLLKKVSQALDKAVKTKYIHLNKASRLKSRLSHLILAKTKTKTVSVKATP